MRERVGVSVVGAALAASGLLWAAEVPLAVSPGRADTGAVVDTRCPTFSWGMVAGASGYELLVYQVAEDGQDTEPVLRESFPGSVHSWTPAMDRCLTRGAQYAWSIRATRNGKASEWSAPSLFAVDAGPGRAELGAALEIVRRHFAESETQVAPEGDPLEADRGHGAAPGSPPAASRRAPAPFAVRTGDDALQVNGAAVVTTATFSAALASIELECPGALTSGNRYTACGDGTVRDNNTGLYWLRRASCNTLGNNGDGSGTMAEAIAAVAALADGECFLSDGSQPGDWRLATRYEFCKAQVFGNNACPASAAPSSLVDSTVGPPTLVDEAGTGGWTPGNIFFGVELGRYYAKLEGVGRYIYAFDLTTGTYHVIDVIAMNPSDYYIWPVREGL